MISKKQKQILTFPYEEDNYGLICDGAIRTGKTIWCSISFILWAMSNFSGRNFGICSKTIGTAIRNVINPLLEIKYLTTILISYLITIINVNNHIRKRKT
jgi:hypothetical protein